MTALSSYKRLVIKIGSGLLVDYKAGTIRTDWLASLVDDIAALRDAGCDVVVVSSGAIAMGRCILGLDEGRLKLEESQAAASVGQIELAPAWEKALGARGLTAGQILLTLADTEMRRRYLNARATINTLLKFGAVPIINENDAVATTEIRYGDNDRLAARVATMLAADCLILLSDIDGLYDKPPSEHPDANHIPRVDAITPEIEAMGGTSDTAYGSGGMATKIDAAKIAINGGTSMVIASGEQMSPLSVIDKGARCTWFHASDTPLGARKKWISGHLKPSGSLTLDDGAVKALQSGKSLLPAGVTKVAGAFELGDAVLIEDQEGAEIGVGLVAYDIGDAQQIIGEHSSKIESILGHPGRSVMMHRDDMVLRDASGYTADD